MSPTDVNDRKIFFLHSLTAIYNDLRTLRIRLVLSPKGQQEKLTRLENRLRRLHLEIEELERGVLLRWIDDAEDLTTKIQEAKDKIDKAEQHLDDAVDNANAFAEIIGSVDDLIAIVGPFI